MEAHKKAMRFKKKAFYAIKKQKVASSGWMVMLWLMRCPKGLVGISL